MNSLRLAIAAMFDPPPEETASDWCCRGNLVIPPPASAAGPFTLAGREYMRELIDDFRNPLVTDEAACFGSQSGKTTALMAGLASKLVGEACAALWVMPNRDLAKSFSKTRWMPFVHASPALAPLVPTGSRRHDFAAMEQRLGASLLTFIGTNSAANLSSRPAPVVILDEVDKFNEGTDKEADAVNLAEQRTKDFSNPKRIKASTPTLSDRIIWQEYLKGDQRRYFVPCPECGKQMVLAFSKHMTVLKPTGFESYVYWDKEAKRKDGIWDLDRVKRSARVQCWNCGKHLTDGHKTRMIRDGEWKPTNPFAPASYRSRHLSSLYASSPETTFGAEAVKFIQAKTSLMGLQGFINGELAEPFESQDTQTERVEIVTPEGAPPLADKTWKLIAADFQQVGPKIPWVAREFARGGHSRLIDFGFFETFTELREKQLELGIEDEDVGIDSGHEATTIYEECLRWGKFRAVMDAERGHSINEWFGWLPMKGRESSAFWTSRKTGQRQVYGISSAPLPHSRFRLPLVEFNGPAIKDILERLRRRQTDVRWELTEKANAEYFRHLDSEIKKAKFDPRTKRVIYEWTPRSKTWPNHWKDCEIMLLARIMMVGVLTLDPAKHTTNENVPAA